MRPSRWSEFVSRDVDDTWLFVFISSVVNVTLFIRLLNFISSEESVHCKQKKKKDIKVVPRKT